MELQASKSEEQQMARDLDEVKFEHETANRNLQWAQEIAAVDFEAVFGFCFAALIMFDWSTGNLL